MIFRNYAATGTCLAFIATAALSVQVQPCHAGEEATAGSVVQATSISSTEALRLAQIGLAEGKKAGTEVAVVISSASGLPLVLLRTDSATEQFVTGATRKAWTAINFKDSTKNLFKTIQSNHQDDSQLPMAKNALFLYGGEPIKLNGAVIGGVGVAGFVDGEGDARVAKLVADSFNKEAAAKK